MSGLVLPSPQGSRSPDDPAPQEQLFADLVVSNPPHRRAWFGVQASLFAHGVILAAVVLVPIFWPQDLPETAFGLRVLIYDPPAAAAAPLPKGSSPLQKMERPRPVTPQETKKPTLEVQIERPQEQPLEPEPGTPETEQYGSPTGSDLGSPDGMEGGVDGGVPGGVLGGVPGGCIGCTGSGPVLDYDQPPRLIRQIRPEYPQEAFVKKIDGVVILQVLIDGTGRVVRHEILKSVPALDRAAIQCVYQWQFAPALKRGVPVATLATIPVSFTMY
ncbi:MAG: TonB family protein [Acidobacteria bacterium]|nr:TonB family protein [Acidobacteriota bacterium]